MKCGMAGRSIKLILASWLWVSVRGARKGSGGFKKKKENSFIELFSNVSVGNIEKHVFCLWR